MKRWAAALGGGAGLLLIGGAVALRGHAPAPDRRPRVRVVAADLSVTVTARGVIEAAKPVPVATPVGGRLTRWLVNVGDQVVAGQPLAIVESPGALQSTPPPAALNPLPVGPTPGGSSLGLADPAIAQAEGRVSRLRAEVGKPPVATPAQIEAKRARLLQAQEERRRLAEVSGPAARAEAVAALDAAKADLVDAQAESARHIELERQGVVTARSVQSAKLAVGVAQDRVDSAQAALDGSAAKLASDLARLDATIRRRLAEFDRTKGDDSGTAAKREELREAEAELARLRQRTPSAAPTGPVTVDPPILSGGGNWRGPAVLTEVRATASGIVTGRSGEVGGVLKKGDPVMTLQNRVRWIARLILPPSSPSPIRPGLPVAVRKEPKAGEAFAARIVRVSGREAEAVLLSAQSGLRSGLGVYGEIQIARQKGAISLPREAIRGGGETPYVEVADGAGVRRLAVRLGLNDGKRIEILSGLRLGDEVLVSDATPEATGVASSPKQVQNTVRM